MTVEAVRVTFEMGGLVAGGDGVKRLKSKIGRVVSSN